MSLLSELKRRNVLRMAMLYVLVAWVIMQIVEVVMSLAVLPPWIGQATLLLLTVGFPIVLIFSWFYEITPEGLALEKDVPRNESITQLTGRRINYIVIAILCAAVIMLAVDKWWVVGPAPQSIAVLPFDNVSADPLQEYFSDGISEEILGQLSKIPELQVTSRSSAFSYKGRALNLSDVARELNVAHLLVGSVRNDGRRVRITAQLIDANSDTHLWSEAYDRTLNDIFAVQNEIAIAVVDNLKVAILGELPKVQETNPDVYAAYLQARHLTNMAQVEGLKNAVDILKQNLAIDPNYAPAWLELGRAYDRLATTRAMPSEVANSLSLEAVAKAIDLSPGSGQAHNSLAWKLFKNYGDLDSAADHFERAMSLDPTNTDIIGNVSIFLSALGRLDESIRFGEYQVSRDPANAVAFNNLGLRYRYIGQFGKTRDAFSTTLTLNPGFSGAYYELGAAQLENGDIVAAESAFENETIEVFRQIGLAMTTYAKGQFEKSDQLLDSLVQAYGDRIAFYIAQIHAFRGDNDGSFEWLDRAKTANDRELSTIINEPLFSKLHADRRWNPFLESIGKSPAQLAAIDFNVVLPN